VVGSDGLNTHIPRRITPSIDFDHDRTDRTDRLMGLMG